MYCSPSKFRQNKPLKGRTISFETATKTSGNMIIVATTDMDGYIDTISGTLFRPMQLLASYVPRKIKPMGRQAQIINQKDYYTDLRTKTHGRIRRGKTLLSTYNGANVSYDFITGYNINKTAFEERGYVRQRYQSACYNYLEETIKTNTSDPDYENAYLIFPMTKAFDNSTATRVFISGTEFTTGDPLALFIQAIKNDTLNLKAFEKIKMVFFYIPKSDIIMAMDIHDPDFAKNFPMNCQKLKRMNSFLLGQDDLSDELEDEEEGFEYLSDADKLENKKEDIKKVVLSNIAKSIHINNLTDFEASTRDEKDIMSSIDSKVEKYILKPENRNKTIADMISDIEKDNDVKTKIVRYVETKKASIIKAENLNKNIDKETEIIGSIQDLSTGETSNDGTRFKVKNAEYLDPSVCYSRLDSIDEEYNKKQRSKDLANVISSFSNAEYSPMIVTNVDIADTSNDTDEKESWTIHYKTDEGKSLSTVIDIPKVYDKRYLYLGGNKKVIKKQLTRLPIVKTKPDRVEITTNYNKITISRTSGNVSRKNMYIMKKLKEMEKDQNFTIEYGDNQLANSKMGYYNDFEYEELSGKISTIVSGSYHLSFNRDNMAAEIELLDIDENFINDKRTPLGLIKHEDVVKALVYIEDSKIWIHSLGNHESELIKNSLFEFLVEDIFHMDMKQVPSVGHNFMYTKMKVLTESFPMLLVIASQKGLTNILDRYKIKYYKREKPERGNINYVEVKFKDCYLYYEDTPRNTLLMNAIYIMDPAEYEFNQFDSDAPYTRCFMKLLGDRVGIHTRNMLRINLNVFVDPITRDVLRDLNQPTDIIDMLLYSNTLLVGNQYKTLNDVTNYRIRGNEIVPASVYQILAGAYIRYAKHRINGQPINLTIQKSDVIKELLKQTNINDKSTLNPVAEAEEIAQASAKGPHGVNRSDAFTLEMRSYSDSMAGVLSANATPFSGSAGITRSLAYDPKLNTVRGYIPYNDGKLYGPNLLSPTELLSSFTSACADASRQAMQVAQTGHSMPIAKTSKQLIGSGMNKTLAFLLSDDFCFKAKKSGVIQKIDNDNKLAILLYDDGTKDAIDLDDKLNKNSNMGFYIHQVFKIVYSEGEKFEEGDVIAYNPDYFTGKGKDVDYKPGVLAKVAIAAGDFAFEDSSFVSDKLCNKCAGRINMPYQTVLGKNANIHSIVEKGDKVKTGEPLIEFTMSFDDADTNTFLQKLGDTLDQDQINELTYEKKLSKHTGTVTKIEILYNCDFNELSKSLQDLIKKYRGKLTKRVSALEGVKTNSVHIPPIEQTDMKKSIKAEFPEDGGVIINIWVEYIDKLGMGDKITMYTALKGVVSKVVDDDTSPLTDYRPEEALEAILTPTGYISRMTCDIYYVLYGNKVLVELGKQIREIWGK